MAAATDAPVLHEKSKDQRKSSKDRDKILDKERYRKRSASVGSYESYEQ